MRIYKYRPGNEGWITDILPEGQFYFSSWRYLNDPMEGFFRYYASEHPQSEIADFVESKDKYNVCCCSLVSDDIFMWTHYASNHQGICIEIDVDEERSNDVTFEPIKYQPNIPWLRKHNGQMRDAKDILSMKISKWRYEKEIRAFCANIGNNTHKIGRITKIILGLRIEDHLKRIVKQCAGNMNVVEAHLNFDTNTIDA